MRALRAAILVLITMATLATACSSDSKPDASKPKASKSELGGKATLTAYTYAPQAKFTMNVTTDGTMTLNQASLAGIGATGVQADKPLPVTSDVTVTVTTTATPDGDNTKVTVVASDQRGTASFAGRKTDLGKSQPPPVTSTYVVGPDGTPQQVTQGAPIGQPGSVGAGEALQCPALPAGGVKTGATWETEVTPPGFEGQQSKVKAEHTFIGAKTINGTPALVINTKTAGPLDSTLDFGALLGSSGMPAATADLFQGIKVAFKGDVSTTSTCIVTAGEKHTLLGSTNDGTSRFTTTVVAKPANLAPQAAAFVAVYDGTKFDLHNTTTAKATN